MRRIKHNPEYCIACKLCEVYCLTAHSRSKNVLYAYTKELPRIVPRTVVEEKELEASSVQCKHCEEPHCVEACMTGALQKQPSGEVLCDTDKCVGCWMCIMVCPFGAIERQVSENQISAKCDLCTGREIPACVENCPNRALVFEDV